MDVDGGQAYAALVSNPVGQRSQLPNDSGATTSTVVAETLNGKGKARKPYTITKQRERWSEEEHLRFIEALRLHGRAWRKIEEHIGTKTAVQIRSHAQKFFNKLEKKKEAGEAPDKEENFTIPPPRPKRKPAKPYPRKDGVTSSGYTGTSQLSPQLHALQQQLPAGAGGFSLGPAAAAVVAAAAAAGGGGSHHMGLLNGLAAAAAAEQAASSSEVTDATVAAVTAAASAAAAAAAAAVVAAAGQEVQTHMQVHPPSCFPFFGLPPSALAQVTPHGATTLDQAALLTQHVAAAKAAAALRGFGAAGATTVDAAAAAKAAAAGAVPAALAAGAGASVSPGMGGGMGMLGDGGDRGLVEATGTTDGTHISANAQLRGSDGDSACSRETDNQDTPGVAMDASWQSKLLHQTLQQHAMNSTNPAAAARLAGQQPLGFDPSQLQWGMGRCYEGSTQGMNLPGPGLPGLQGLSAAQALALLCNPLYAAAAERQYQHQSVLEAAAAAGHADGMATAGQRSCEGVAASSGERGAAGGASGRSKNWRTAPSVNSGSTGPPLGVKRALEAGNDGGMPARKAARDLSDTCEEGAGMEVSPSSPSIEEKELKAASQPSNTNGNTCGSNESDASKRRQGTVQGEGSNPTNGNSSGNGCSVKDSNTGTHTGTHGHTHGNGHGYSCGNGTSAFHPVGHHHQHGSSQQQSCRTHAYYHGSRAGSGGHNAAAAAAAAGEGSNGGVGASGTGVSTRDEGRSSSDLEGPVPGQHQRQMQQQQRQLRFQMQLQQEQQGGDDEDDDDDDMEEDEPEGSDDDQGDDGEQEQQQDSDQAAQLQAIMAQLHGVCDNPLMLQQAYGAAAAAATAQQIMTSAMQGTSAHAASNSGPHQLAAALQQHLQRAQGGGGSSAQAPPVSQGFAPWHGSGSAFEFGSSGSFVTGGLLQQQQQQLAGNSGGGPSAAQQQALQLQAAAGLMGLASSWDTASAGSAGVGGDLSSAGALYGAYAHQMSAHHYHQHHHYHHQQQQRGSVSGGPGASSSAAATAAAGLQQLQQGLAGRASSSGGGTGHLGGLAEVLRGYPGLDALAREAVASGLATAEGHNSSKRDTAQAAS